MESSKLIGSFRPLPSLYKKLCTFGEDEGPGAQFWDYLYRLLLEEMENRLNGVRLETKPQGINEQNGSKHSFPQ